MVLPRLINQGSVIHKTLQRASEAQMPPDMPAPLHCQPGKIALGAAWGHMAQLFVALLCLPWSCSQVSLAEGVYGVLFTYAATQPPTRNQKPPEPFD